MNFIENHLAYYNKNANSNTELELKIMIDSRISRPPFIKVGNYDICDSLKAIIKTRPIHETSQTINFIKNLPNYSMFVSQLVFEKNIQNKEKKSIYIKKQLSKPIYFLEAKYPIKLCINSEIKQEHTIIDKYDVIRIRNRISYMIGKWRLDITFLHETSNNDIDYIKKIKDNLFSIDDVLSINPIDVTRVECELEYIYPPSKISIDEIFDLLHELSLYDTNNIYNDNLVMIAKICDNKNLHKFISCEYGFKQISPHPIEITKKFYSTEVYPNITNFIITEKIDGLRHILIINVNTGLCYVLNGFGQTSINVEIYTTEHNNDMIIIDVELCDGKYYIFDIVQYNNVNISKMPFINRLEYIRLLYNKYDIIKIKTFIELTVDFKNEINDLNDIIKKGNIPNDGIIFIPKDKNYLNTVCLKWKPIEKTTIDFLAMTCPKYLLGISPYVIKQDQTLYLLFSGIKSNDYKKIGVKKHDKYDLMFNYVKHNDLYYPLQFSPSSNIYAFLFWSHLPTLHNKIVELNRPNNKWNLVKIRDDRQIDLQNKSYYGNYFKFAELIWMNYTNPIKFTDLLNPESGYFKIHNNDSYKYVRRYNNFVKSKLYKLYEDEEIFDWVIDLAAGKGQDLIKLLGMKAKNILFIDNDANALEEIINRKYDYINNRKYLNKCNIYISNTDLTNNFKTIIESLRSNIPIIPSGVSLLICNFAVHYLTTTKKNILNFVRLINTLLKKNGIFIMTCFDPIKIKELIKDGNWIREQYSITKVNEQYIKVKLPFSEEAYLEYITDIDTINKEMALKKIELVCSDSFISFINLYNESNKLTDADKQFIGLYKYYIYKK
jgi:SAM-dependent methyltransferase